MQFNLHYILANGLRHRVLDWSSHERQLDTIFLIHGFQDSASTWNEVASDLASAGYRVIAPDLRGFGDTEPIGKGGYYHFFDYIFDVADLIDYFCLSQKIFLIGHSMGGVIASLYSGSFPERINKLVLLEGLGPEEVLPEHSPTRVRSWIEEVRNVRTRNEEPTFTLEEAVHRLARNHPHISKEVLTQCARELTRSTELLSENSLPLQQEDKRTWKFDPLHRTRSPLGFSKARWKAHVQQITAPTLFVHGGTSGLHVSDEQERIQTFPNISSVEIREAGHMMHWTEPHKLTKILVDWFMDSNNIEAK